jgi:hypothetical protein
MNLDCESSCPNSCESVFSRVVVRHYISGGSFVFWELVPTFFDPGPYTFQLQVNTVRNPRADDWLDVGLPVTNSFSAVDTEKRVWGKELSTHYRVVLTTPNATYYSDPVSGLGVLTHREWMLAREIIRQRKVRYRKGFAAQEGYLLKKRITGRPCSRCVDLQTQQSQDPNCPQCFGTGYACGYYYPISCSWALIEPESKNKQIENTGVRGQIEDVNAMAEMLMIDTVSNEDVWVSKKTDERYFIREVRHTAEVRGIALVGQVRLALISMSSPIYDIVIPDQLKYLEELRITYE